MARPRSDAKRNAILDAATRVIAVEGVSAPTAKIAKLARVAEGTLFTYFNNKDELLNELYLQLKTELRETLAAEALSATKVARILQARRRAIRPGWLQSS